MHLLDHSPKISSEAAHELVRKLYGLRAAATNLPSERDQNFLLTTDVGENFVLKIANALEDRILLETQNAMMGYLATRVDFCQRVVKTLAGDELVHLTDSSGKDHCVRMVTYIPGIPLAKSNSSSSKVLRDLGRNIGKLDAIFSTFDHPALHRDFHWDLRSGFNVINQYSDLIDDVNLRDIVRDCASRVANCETIAQLRCSVIHGDANDYNVIVNGTRVVGLIDFGDAVHSYTVGDLAIALAYVVLDKTDPLPAAAEVIAGYHEEHPLAENELRVLFDLMLLRLAMSVCHAAHQQQAQPNNEYLNISQLAITKSLPELAKVDRLAVAETFSNAARG